MGEGHPETIRRVLIRSALATSAMAAVRLAWTVPTVGPSASAVHLLWLAGVWAALAWLVVARGLFGASQAALAGAVALAVAAWLEARPWFGDAPVRWLDPRVLQAEGIALSLLGLAWIGLRLGVRSLAEARPKDPRLGTARRLLEPPWPTFDRLTSWAAVAVLVVLSVYGAMPGAAQELSPRSFAARLVASNEDAIALNRVVPPASAFEVAGIPHRPASGPGSWLLLGAALLVLLAGQWERFRRARPARGDARRGDGRARWRPRDGSRTWRSARPFAGAGRSACWRSRCRSGPGGGWPEQPGGSAGGSGPIGPAGSARRRRRWSSRLATLPLLAMAAYEAAAALHVHPVGPGLSDLWDRGRRPVRRAGRRRPRGPAVGRSGIGRPTRVDPGRGRPADRPRVAGPARRRRRRSSPRRWPATRSSGPSRASFFDRIGPAGSYAPPIVLVALVLVGHAIRGAIVGLRPGRRPAAAGRRDGRLDALGPIAGRAARPDALAPPGPAQRGRRLDVCHRLDRRCRRPATATRVEAGPAAAGPAMAVQVALPAALVGLVLVVGILGLLADPGVGRPSAAAIADPWGWAAFLLTAGAAAAMARRSGRRPGPRFVATGGADDGRDARLQRGPSRRGGLAHLPRDDGRHGRGGRGAAALRMEPPGAPARGRDGAGRGGHHAVGRARDGCCSSCFALRAYGERPGRTRRGGASAACATSAILAAALAGWSAGRGCLYVAGVLLNLAATLWWLDVPPGWLRESLGNVVVVNVIALALPVPAWLVVRAAGDPAGPRPRPPPRADAVPPGRRLGGRVGPVADGAGLGGRRRGRGLAGPGDRPRLRGGDRRDGRRRWRPGSGTTARGRRWPGCTCSASARPAGSSPGSTCRRRCSAGSSRCCWRVTRSPPGRSGVPATASAGSAIGSACRDRPGPTTRTPASAG